MAMALKLKNVKRRTRPSPNVGTLPGVHIAAEIVMAMIAYLRDEKIGREYRCPPVRLRQKQLETQREYEPEHHGQNHTQNIPRRCKTQSVTFAKSQPALDDVPEGDGALDLGAALDEAFQATTHQRCWMIMSPNIFSYVPQVTRVQVDDVVHRIWSTGSREATQNALSLFDEEPSAKYPGRSRISGKTTTDCSSFLFSGRTVAHIRTTNAIESSSPCCSTPLPPSTDAENLMEVCT